MVVRTTEFERTKPASLGFETHQPSRYNNSHINVRRAVHEEKMWGAIIINANATALLRHAVETGNSSYDPLGACQIVYNQARDIESYNQYVIPSLLRLANDISSSFGRNWTSRVLSNATLSPSTFNNSPQALSPAIGFSIFDLRPFDPPVAIPAVSIGLIYLIIIAFFSFSFFLPTHMLFVAPNPSSPHPPLKFVQLITYRYIATLTTYLFLSLSYSFVSLAFLIPMNNSPPDNLGYYPAEDVFNNANPLGRGTFPVYWMLNFFGMTALGLSCENVAHGDWHPLDSPMVDCEFFHRNITLLHRCRPLLTTPSSSGSSQMSQPHSMLSSLPLHSTAGAPLCPFVKSSMHHVHSSSALETHSA